MSTHHLVLVDGVPQNVSEDKTFNWNAVPLEDVERVEVVRGPYSALYGENAMGGVVNIITKKGKGEPRVTLSSGRGTFDTEEQYASLAGLFGGVDCFLSAKYKQSDTFRKHGEYRSKNFFLKLGMDPSEDSRLSFSVGRFEANRGAIPWALTEAELRQKRDQARPGTKTDSQDTDRLTMALNYSHRLGDAITVDETAYFATEERDAFSTSWGNTRNYLDEERTYGLMNKVTAKTGLFGFDHELLAGFDLEKGTLDNHTYLAPAKLRGTLTGNFDVSVSKSGCYLQDSIALHDDLKLLFGHRWDVIKYRFENHLDITASKDRTLKSANPRAGLVWTYDDIGSSAYASWSRAFRAPTLGQMFTYGASANPELDPERAVNYEIGATHNFGKGVTAHAAAYYMRVKDEILYDFALFQYKNAGKTRHKGIEAGIDAELFGGVSVFGSHTLSHAQYTTGADRGNYIESSPKYMTGYGLRYDGGFGLTAQAGGRSAGKIFLDPANTRRLRQYTVWDFSVAYEKDFFTISLGVDNLFDYKYASYGFVSGGAKSLSPAAGRTFMLRLTLDF